MSELPPAQLPPNRQRSHGLSWFVSWLLILVTVGYVMTKVNLSVASRSAHLKPTTFPATSPAIEPQDSDAASGAAGDRSAADANFQLRIVSRYAVGTKAFTRKYLATSTPQNLNDMLKQVDALASTPEEKLRAAVVAGEVGGAGEALQRLDDIDSASEDHADPDLESLTTIYTSGADELDAAQREALIGHLGWWGRLALSFDKPETDPARQEVMKPAARTFITFIVIIVLLVIGLIAGLVLLILAVVLVLTGKIRPRYVPVPPLVPGADGSATAASPLFLEAFALYLVSFVLFTIALSRFVKTPTMSWYMIATIILPIALSWPAVRGMRWREVLLGFGWHRGRGVLREMGSGVAGYLAGLPLLAIAFFISQKLAKLAGVNVTHPIVEQFTRRGWELVPIYLLASVWAPIMEETMFRGAFYNHFRARRWNWLLSACIVGFFFAAIHPQGWTLIPMLGAIGAVLACIREWRGSIIGSMTAHALSNALVVTLGVMLLG